jgi:nucleoside-diphosphate-sugar epimerase
LRCLVLGGTGFIGTAACRELMRRGVETIAVGRTPRPYGTFTSHVVLDRRQPGALAEAVGRTRPDVLLDLAGFLPAQVETVLDLPLRRYVFVSTAGVYPDRPPDDPRPAAEDDFRPLEGPVPAADLDYREGKRWCETVLVRSRAVAWATLRPPAVFGPDDPSLRIAAWLARITDGGPLLVPSETLDRPIGLAWVRDVGYACALACDLDREVSGAYNVALADVTLRQLLEAMARALGRRPQLVPVPWQTIPRDACPYGDPSRPAGYELARARRDLGFRPSALEDGLAETLAWYLARRPSHPGYRNRASELELAARLAAS